MAKKPTKVTEVTKVEYPVLEEGTVAAKIIKDGDELKVMDLDNNYLGSITRTIEEGRTYALPNNPANRKWISVALVARTFDAGAEEIMLTYKASKHFGTSPNRGKLVGVNKKLLEYLSDEEKAEVEAIIGRALEARQAEMDAIKAAKNDPIAKLKATIEKLHAKLDELEGK